MVISAAIGSLLAAGLRKDDALARSRPQQLDVAVGGWQGRCSPPGSFRAVADVELEYRANRFGTHKLRSRDQRQSINCLAPAIQSFAFHHQGHIREHKSSLAARLFMSSHEP